MKDFTDFVNFYNLDCQHLAFADACQLASLVLKEVATSDIEVPGELIELISKIATEISVKQSMTMLRCYHEWLSESSAT